MLFSHARDEACKIMASNVLEITNNQYIINMINIMK